MALKGQLEEKKETRRETMRSGREEGKPCFRLPAKIKDNSREAMFDV